MSDLYEEVEAALTRLRERDLDTASDADVAVITDMLGRIKRGGALLGRIIDQWGADIVRIAEAEDLITEDGDGDWELIWERLEAVRMERDRLRKLLDPADPAVIDRVSAALSAWVLGENTDAPDAARAVLAALGGDRAAREPHTSGPWDIGDPDPGPTITAVMDEIGTLDDFGSGGDHAEWHRTTDGSWKGYKDGGKTYLPWPELVRRWGPVRLRNAGDQR